MTYHTASDVARALNLSTAAVRVMVVSGRLHPVATTTSGTRLYDPADVARLVAAREAQVRRLRGRPA